ncbi:MAG: CBS domain-containing protein [Lachnospiraceae bacterium]|nr:CBS domain-containing protein [Lachnospiraceae bacterium]
MNILACLTPKSDVDFVTDEATLFKVLQTMENRNFSAIPIINKKGRYVGTITSGDILGCIKENFNLSVKDSAKFPVRSVRRTRDYKAIGVHATIEEILDVAVDQNFVPVVDDEDNFIGILTRKEIMKWMREEYNRDHPEGGN